eukprot:3633790-Alexandrium_andersonii.AAC.1
MGAGPQEDTGCPSEGMPGVGEQARPEQGTEDVGEEMRFLRTLVAPEKFGGEREAEAVDLTRALFAAGTTPRD